MVKNFLPNIRTIRDETTKYSFFKIKLNSAKTYFDNKNMNFISLHFYIILFF